MFVAVQRITTARWSRPIIRFIEGYVAFLPVAFVLLADRPVPRDATTSFRGRTRRRAIPRSAIYLNPTFLITRDIVLFGDHRVAERLVHLHSVRLDVGLAARERARRGPRAFATRMRRGFRDERRELHSTHSLQGKLAVFLVLAFGYWLVGAAGTSRCRSTLHFQSTMYGWWFFMGGWLAALMSWSLLVHGVAPLSRAPTT